MQIKGFIRSVKVQPTKKADVYQLGLLIEGTEGKKWYNTITKFPNNFTAGEEVMFVTEKSTYNGKEREQVVLGTLKKVKQKGSTGVATTSSVSVDSGLAERVSKLESRLKKLEESLVTDIASDFEGVL